ncbi:MAG: NAD(P)-dependent oxidoreductase [Armatimonadetes bacterium]|nr:NAD(P)-dependent oxidoreductase [Armatimonadota bacterium]
MSAAGRLLVTGASGFVGGNVVARAGLEWEVHAVSRRAVAGAPPDVAWHVADIGDPATLHALFEHVRPTAVIHGAAAADIDWCGRNRAEAWRINVGITAGLAELCAAGRARLVHMSTDNVFDGKRGMLTEADEPNPVNYYGETKLEAERAVASMVPAHVIARLALVVGLPAFGEGNSFLSRMRAAWEEGRTVVMPDEEVRSPVDVVTLSRALLHLANGTFTGVLHLPGADRLDRVTMARRIAARLGYRADQVVARKPDPSPDRSDRPLDVSMSGTLAAAILPTPLPGLDAGLDLVLAEARNPP